MRVTTVYHHALLIQLSFTFSWSHFAFEYSRLAGKAVCPDFVWYVTAHEHKNIATHYLIQQESISSNESLKLIIGPQRRQTTCFAIPIKISGH